MGLFLLFGLEADLDELAHALGQRDTTLLRVRGELGERVHLKTHRRPRHLIAAGGMAFGAHQPIGRCAGGLDGRGGPGV